MQAVLGMQGTGGEAMRKAPLDGGSARLPRAVLVLCVLGAVFAVGFGIAGAAESSIEEPLWTKCDSGDAEVQCDVPRGVAASSVNGHLYVADQTGFRMLEFNAVGKFIRAWGSAGSGVGQFGEFGPQGVALDSVGDVYVVDFSNRRVEKFDPDGNFLLMFGGEVNKTKSEEGGSTEGERNLCPIDPGDVCQPGISGTGQGQFGTWRVGSFITVTPGDKVYVGDRARIQRFDADGHYQDDISLPGRTVKGLASDSEGNLYAIYNNEFAVRKISPGGVELESPRFVIGTPSEGGGALAASAVGLDSAGHVFAFGPTSCCGGQNNFPPIWEFDSSGNPIAKFGEGEFSSLSTGIATNICSGSEAPGNLYVTNPSSTEGFVRAYGTEPVGCVKARTGPATEIEETAATLTGSVNPDESPVSACAFDHGLDNGYGEEVACSEYEAGEEWHPLVSPAELGEGSDPVPVRARIEGLSAGTVYHFRLRATVDGNVEPGFDEQFKTLGPPVIEDDKTLSVTDTEATLGAKVNPEGLTTNYRFQYGPSAGTYDHQTPIQSLGADREAHAVQTTISGLAPGATYHWRIVASNESGPSEGADHALTTYQPFEADAACPNQSLRTGLSALLPDCRAYEMVSPVDKNGGDVVSGAVNANDPSGYIQASPDGGRIVYTSRASFGDEPAGLRFNEYLASRDDTTGWISRGINAPFLNPALSPGVGGFKAARAFMAFTPDLCSGWLVDEQNPPLADGQAGLFNLYRRQNCVPGEGFLEALAPSPPALSEGIEKDYVGSTSVQGVSEDGRRAVFLAKAPLAVGAASNSNSQIYERSGGANHLVSVLPSGEADPQIDEVGSGWSNNLAGAMSGGGSRVYWTSNPASGHFGVLYLREHAEQGIVANECEGENACTTHVGGSSTFSAFFWSASPDGSRALYSEKIFGEAEPDLYEFRLGEPRRLIAHNVMGVAGQSKDLSRIYFVSESNLAEGAQEGKPNLYLSETDASGETRTIRFVATLARGDVGALEPGFSNTAYNLIGIPYERATRVSADGRRIVFQSRAPLTGFDNADATSERADVEVFSYDAAGGQLDCVSCNPSGAAPRGREMLLPYKRPWEHLLLTGVHAAAWIPTWEHPLHASNVISADGTRIFFNSNDRLLPADANSAQDVYEWEEAGAGKCTASSHSFFAANGGCLYLISSGEGSFEAEFWEASESGDDVFFTTDKSLVAKDPGLIDLYDARVGGGFAEAAPPAACEGEACQSPPAAPGYSDPGSSTYSGPENPPAMRDCGAAARRAARLSHRAKRLRRNAARVARNADARKAGRLRARARASARQAKRLSRSAKRCRRANRRAAR